MTQPSRPVHSLRVALLALLALVALLPASAHATSLMVEHFDQPGTGMNQAAFDAAGHMGARYARQIVEHGATPWGTSFNWDGGTTQFVQGAIDHEMKPYLTLSGNGISPTTQQFGQWCGEAASRYDGQAGRPLVLDYGVWNEPNLNGVAAASYRALYRACRSAIKAVRSDANVYFGEIEAGSPGGCTYLSNALPAVPSASDPVIVTEGVAIHPYQYATHPRTALAEDCRGIGNLPRWTAAIASATAAGRISKSGGGAPPVLVSEFGYCTERPSGDYPAGAAQAACPQNSSGLGNKLDEQTRAAWIQAAYGWAEQNGVPIFDYHGLVKRPIGNFIGNTGYLWESGIIDNPSGARTPSVNALRAATGTVAPGVATSAATQVSQRTATLNGEVNPQGFQAAYRFEYGTDASYGNSVPVPDGQLAAGSSAVPVSHAIEGLQADRTYHYRLVARTRAGESATADATFRTAPMPRPSAVVTSSGTKHVFYRGLDGRLNEWRWDGSAWEHRGWGHVGALAGDPAAVATGGGAVEVFYRTATGQLGRWWLNGPGWNHTEWGRANAMAGDPSAVATGDGNVEVFYRTGVGQLGRWWFNGERWNHTEWGYQNAVTGDPSAVSTGGGNVEVFYRTGVGQLGRWWFNDDRWNHTEWGYQNAMASDPSAVVKPGGRIEVFYRTSLGQLGRWWFEGADWSHAGWGYEGAVASQPSATVTPSGRVEVAYRTSQRQLGRWWFAGSDWSTADVLTAGAIAGDPDVVAVGGVVSAFFGGPDGEYYDYSYESAGPGWSFARLRPAPVATIADAIDVGLQQATLRGTVDPRGLRTRWTFQYGTTRAYGSNAPISDGDAGDGNGPVEVRAVADDLLAGTTYHYRLVATSSMGTVYSEDRTFTTAPMPKPSAVVTSDGDKHLFYRALNGQLQEWRWDGTAWSHHEWGYQGALAGNPSAVVTADDVIEVFYRAVDGGQLWRWRIDGASWSHTGYGDAGAVAADPSAVATGGENVEVFYRTSLGQLGRWWFNGAQWNHIGYGYQGAVTGVPSAVAGPSGTVDVLYRTAEGQMGRWTFVGEGWSHDGYGYQGSVTGNPSAIGSPGGGVEALYRTSDGQLGRWSLLGSDWSHTGYGAVGSIVGDPSAIATGAGAFEVFHRTSDGRLGRWWISGSDWNPTTWGQAGSVAGDPIALRLSDGTLNVFYGRPDTGWAMHEFSSLGTRYQPLG